VRARVQVRLSKANDDTAIWADQLDFRADDSFAAQDSIAARVTRAVRGAQIDMPALRADVSPMFTLTKSHFEEVRARIGKHIKHTPLLSSRQLSELTGFEARLKAEMFQRVGSYKIRGPLNKFALMPEEQKRKGVVCSSAGNHAQGVALAAKIHGIRAVVCMATNASRRKSRPRRDTAPRSAPRTIWDEANEKARNSCARRTHVRASVRRRAAHRRDRDAGSRGSSRTGRTSTRSSCRSAAAA